MNKKDLINAIAEKGSFSKKDAEIAANAFMDTVKEALQNGDKVTLTGFGTFEVRDVEARVGRNPQTGQQIEIRASKRPVFKAGKGLKDAVN